MISFLLASISRLAKEPIARFESFLAGPSGANCHVDVTVCKALVPIEEIGAELKEVFTRQLF